MAEAEATSRGMQAAPMIGRTASTVAIVTAEDDTPLAVTTADTDPASASVKPKIRHIR